MWEFSVYELAKLQAEADRSKDWQFRRLVDQVTELKNKVDAYEDANDTLQGEYHELKEENENLKDTLANTEEQVGKLQESLMIFDRELTRIKKGK